MNWVISCSCYWTAFIYRSADDIDDTSQRAIAHRHCDRATSILRYHPADHSVCGKHRDCSDAPFAKVLLDFADDIDRLRHLKAVTRNAQRLINRRQVTFRKFHVYNWSNYLHNLAD